MEILEKEILTPEEIPIDGLTSTEKTIARCGDAIVYKKLTGVIVKGKPGEERKRIYTVYNIHNTPVISLSDLPSVIARYNSIKATDKPPETIIPD
jgi:hypothetical protein